MSDEARKQVELILKKCEVTFAAVHTGEKNRDGWKCDGWGVSFTKRDQFGLTYEQFEYFTGIGHRKPDDSAMAKLSAYSLRNVSKRTLAWETHYKSFPDKPFAPHSADVLYSLILDSSAVGQSFNSWCSDFGYDTDSRKAEATYRACQENADKLARLFDSVAREALQTALQDY